MWILRKSLQVTHGLLVKPWVWVNGRNHRIKYSLKKLHFCVNVTFNASSFVTNVHRQCPKRWFYVQFLHWVALCYTIKAQQFLRPLFPAFTVESKISHNAPCQTARTAPHDRATWHQTFLCRTCSCTFRLDYESHPWPNLIKTLFRQQAILQLDSNSPYYITMECFRKVGRIHSYLNMIHRQT